jgi:tRNA (guanine37-N1)-methyltransferase
MRVDLVTIFPDFFHPLELSLVGKARAAGILVAQVHDLRDWATDRHRTVDDTPYGGGAGMVMKPDVWGAALDDIAAGHTSDQAPVLVVPTPSGRPFDQRLAEELGTEPWLIFACGRYEGIDARVAHDARQRVRVLDVSIGDYVLNGGEVAAMVMVEAITRILPGVLGNPESLVEESHGADGLLEYPVYTKPPSWRGLDVPEVLLSGHHGRVARWRRDQALLRTATFRPDLLARLEASQLDKRDREVLSEAAGDEWSGGQ